MKKQPSATMSSIPEEIYTEILLRLPGKSIFICNFVCKTWYSLISSADLNQERNPKLILKSYDITNYSILFNSVSYDSLSSGDVATVNEMDYPFKSFAASNVRVMASCNGLLVFLFYHGGWRHFFCIRNPTTGEYNKVPPSLDRFAGYHYVNECDFYYDFKIDDYNLIQFDSSISQYDDASFQIYSLRTNSWTSIQTLPSRISFPMVSGVLVDGLLHWMGKMCVREFSSQSIISMEINNEKLKELQLPKYHSMTKFMDLGVLEGCLCVLISEVKVCVEVWVMQEYGIRESWSPHYVITHGKIVNAYCLGLGFSLKLMWSFENGEILFRSPDKGNLVLYDPKNGSARKPNINSLYPVGEENYFESLVSLYSGTYVGGEEEIKESVAETFTMLRHFHSS